MNTTADLFKETEAVRKLVDSLSGETRSLRDIVIDGDVVHRLRVLEKQGVISADSQPTSAPQVNAGEAEPENE